MINDFNIVPNYDLLNNYILPYTMSDSKELVSVLSNIGVPLYLAKQAMFGKLLKENVQEAVKFCKSVSIPC